MEKKIKYGVIGVGHLGNFHIKQLLKIKTVDLLNAQIPTILNKLSWKKSMKWGENDLYWGRPLKSI